MEKAKPTFFSRTIGWEDFESVMNERESTMLRAFNSLGLSRSGMMGGIDIKPKDKPGKAGFQCFKACYDAGVNFKATGDTLIIAPQFVCEKKHIDEIIEKLRVGISNYAKAA